MWNTTQNQAVLVVVLAVAVFLLVDFDANRVPIIDISSLLDPTAAAAGARAAVVANIGFACRSVGFFYISGTGVPDELRDRIESNARKFFAQPEATKREIDMYKGGRAWRGFFGVGDELTSGKPDQKEGIYFGTEGDAADERPLHGPNLWPAGSDGLVLKEDVQKYMAYMKRIGTVLMGAIGEHLHSNVEISPGGEAQLRASFEEPTELFRIFGYPAPSPTSSPPTSEEFGVGEHSDYGYLTILHQDDIGGLQARSTRNSLLPFVPSLREWTSVPPVRGTFVVNLGDALEHYSAGYFRATPHRVLFKRDEQHKGKQRISFPYFFDPNMEKEMQQVTLAATTSGLGVAQQRLKKRWDGQDVVLFRGKYGDYLKKKISKVFPALFAAQSIAESNTDNVVDGNIGGDTITEFDYGETPLPKTAEQVAKEMQEVMDFTKRLHESQEPLSAEDQIEEVALRERMSRFFAESA